MAIDISTCDSTIMSVPHIQCKYLKKTPALSFSSTVHSTALKKVDSSLSKEQLLSQRCPRASFNLQKASFRCLAFAFPNTQLNWY